MGRRNRRKGERFHEFKSPFLDAPAPSRRSTRCPHAVRMDAGHCPSEVFDLKPTRPFHRRDAETPREQDFETLRPGFPARPARVSEQPASNTFRFPSSPVRAQSKPRTQRRVPLQNSASPRLGGVSQNMSPLFRSWSDQTSREVRLWWSGRSLFVVCRGRRLGRGRPQTTMVCPTAPAILHRTSAADHYVVGGFFLGRVMRFLGVTPTPPAVLRGTRGRRAGLGVGKGGGTSPVAVGWPGTRGCGSSSSSSCSSCSTSATGSGWGGAAGGWNSAPR